jgi:hypothetical protein
LCRPDPAISGGAPVILEDVKIIELNMSHYRALLKLEMADERRATIKNLLAKAMEDLTLSKNRSKLQQQS